MADVSRETSRVPDPPPFARTLFREEPDRLTLLVGYARHLADAGIVRGLIGPREVPRLWERHLLNSAILADLIPRDAAVADVGSGAGLPGVAVAIRRPDLRVTLIEPMQRRVTFLEEVVADLRLSNVEVARGRAEAFHGAREFDVVTARAVASLDQLARWCLPLVRVGGRLLAIKGERAEAEVATAARELRRGGAEQTRIHRLGEGQLTPPVTVVEVLKG